jgi:hypothetical protein
LKNGYIGGSRPSYDSSSSDTNNTNASPAFVERMSHIPFVNSALRVYEQGKASSRMVKVCLLPSPPIISISALKKNWLVWCWNGGIECDNYIKTRYKSSSGGC